MKVLILSHLTPFLSSIYLFIYFWSRQFNFLPSKNALDIQGIQGKHPLFKRKKEAEEKVMWNFLVGDIKCEQLCWHTVKFYCSLNHEGDSCPLSLLIKVVPHKNAHFPWFLLCKEYQYCLISYFRAKSTSVKRMVTEYGERGFLLASP